jgi:HEAT repeat protein
MYDAAAAADLVRKIVKYSEYSLPVLEKIIKNPATPPASAAQAISLMGQIGNKRSKDVLVELLNRKESNLKIEALIALGKLRDRSVIQYISGAMQDTDAMVAETARMVLESLGVPVEEPAAPADTSRSKPPAKPAPPGKAKNGKR